MSLSTTKSKYFVEFSTNKHQYFATIEADEVELRSWKTSFTPLLQAWVNENALNPPETVGPISSVTPASVESNDTIYPYLLRKT